MNPCAGWSDGRRDSYGMHRGIHRYPPPDQHLITTSGRSGTESAESLHVQSHAIERMPHTNGRIDKCCRDPNPAEIFLIFFF